MIKNNDIYILGFSAYQHDSAASIIKNGEIIACAAEERFVGVKHTGEFPYNAVNFCLKEANIGIEQVDHVAFYWKPYKGLVRRLLHIIGFFPSSLSLITYRGGRWKKIKNVNKEFYEKFAKGKDCKYKFHFVEHHLAHAAGTFYVSKFKKAAILTIDGAGEIASTLMAVGDGNKIKKIKEIYYPHSLGNLYSSFTQYLGFRAHNGEGKVMGLAPYGKPKYQKEFKNVLKVNIKKGTFKLNLKYFQHHLGKEPRYSEKLPELFGPPREKDGDFQEYHKDVAATLQKSLEDCAVHLANYLYKKTGIDNLCLNGGVTLNSVMNTRILNESPFKNMFIQPAATDDGASLGAALWVYHNTLKKERKFEMKHVFYGTHYSNEEIEKVLKEKKLKYEFYKDIEKITAKYLAEGKIIGWFQGRMEFGPRSLGCRSIICDPRRSEMKDILNSKVKHREGFRPFAPSILEEHLKEYFDSDYPSPFMLLVYGVKKEKQKVIPAITHVDGTGRVQSVSKDAFPQYYNLINEFYKITKVPVILNTSFNIRGEPIIDTPQQAIKMFLKEGIDILALNNFLIIKS